MWTRVSCEQPLNTSQSILRLRRRLIPLFGVLTSKIRAKFWSKGNLVHIPEPGSGTVQTLVSVVATRRD
jgi:hypothetical protein